MNKNPTIEEYFIEILKNLKTKTSPDYPDYIFYFLPENDRVYIEYNKKTNNAWLRNDKIWSVFESEKGYNYQKIKDITSQLLEEHLKLRGVTTYVFHYHSINYWKNI